MKWLSLYYALRKWRYTEYCIRCRRQYRLWWKRQACSVCCEKLLGYCYGGKWNVGSPECVQKAWESAQECVAEYFTT